MVALAYQNSVPDHVAQEMIRLTSHGFNIIPLGGEDGKSPLCAFAGEPPGLSKSLGLLKAHHTMSYGIRLDGLLVVDADEATPDIEDVIRARFGPSSVQVATPRGRHFWYRHDGGPVPSLRGEGLAVDIKAGSHAYVLGPGSVRPDSGEYIAIKGRLGETALPFPKVARVKSAKTQPAVPVGSRHAFLKKQARAYAETALSRDEIAANLIYDRDTLCEAGGEPMPDTEVVSLADWAWGLRTKPGGLYEGRRSKVKVERAVMDALLARPSGEAAFALYSILSAAHGHTPGKRFGLHFERWKASERISFGRPKYRTAISLLLELGLLRKVGGYIPGKLSQQYQLGLLNVGPSEASPLAPQEQGGRSLSYLSGQKPVGYAESDGSSDTNQLNQTEVGPKGQTATGGPNEQRT